MLTTRRTPDGTYEVYTSWRPEQEQVREMRAVIEAATRMGVLIRVCRDVDRSGNVCPVKALLSVDPSTIETS